MWLKVIWNHSMDDKIDEERQIWPLNEPAPGLILTQDAKWQKLLQAVVQHCSYEWTRFSWNL
jgi:hypothetical protein